ncbi:hypothetical protein ES707_19621 [subsurface metagenome]
MTTTKKTPDITVRGGLINVPSSQKPQPAPRHQPNTPVNKKKVTPKSDHKPYIPEADTPNTKPKADPPTPQEPSVVEPEGDKNNVPTETSESN